MPGTSYVKHTMRNISPGLVEYNGYVETNSTGSVVTTASTVEGRGVSVTRVSEGLYRLTLTENFREIQHAALTLESTANLDRRIMLDDVDETNRRVDFKCVAGGGLVSVQTISSVSAATYTTPILVNVPYAVKLKSASFMSHRRTSPHPADYAVLRIVTVSTAGGGTVSNCTSNFTTTAGTSTILALVPEVLTVRPTAASTCTAGRSWVFRKVNVGNGKTISPGTLSVEYEGGPADVDSTRLRYSVVARKSTVK